MKQPDNTLLQQLREHLYLYPQQDLTPALLHQRGAIFLNIQDSNAFKSEGHPSFNAFCARLSREFPGYSKGTVFRLIEIHKSFTPDQLKDVPTLPLRSLRAALKAPPAYRLRLLQRAATLDSSTIEALAQSLSTCTSETEAEKILNNPTPQPTTNNSPSMVHTLQHLNQLVEAACAAAPQDPSLLQHLRSAVGRCHTTLSAAAAAAAAAPTPERRETPRDTPTQAPAPRPSRPRLRPGRDCFAVPTPLLDLAGRDGLPPNPLEAHSALLVTLLDQIHRCATSAHERPVSQWCLTNARLQLHFNQQVNRFRNQTLHLHDLLKDSSLRCETDLNNRCARDPSLTPDDLLPLPRTLLDAAAQDHPQLPLLCYSVFDEDDPLDEPLPNPSDYEQLLFRIIGLMRAFERHAPRFYDLCGEHPLELSFFYQIYSSILDPLAYLSNLASRNLDAAKAAALQDAAQQDQRITVETSLRDRLVVLGDNKIPDQYILIGQTRDGRYVAISAFTPQVVVTLGTQGWGKSHLGVLLAECCALAPKGVCRMLAPPRSVWFASDWQSGVGNHQALAGFERNPYPDQRRYLREHYLVSSGHRYEGGILLCLPGARDRLTERYAHLVEQGLQIREVRLHRTELGAFGMSQFLMLGAKGLRGRGRTQAHAFVESLIATEGEDLTLAALRRHIHSAKLDARSKGAMLKQLDFLDSITSEDEHLIDVLEQEQPIFVLLESRYLSRESMLALEVVMMNALSRPLRSGADPMRFLFMDELSKRAMTDQSGDFMKGFSSEVRHRPVTLYGSGQLPADLPPDFLSLATIIGVFHLSSAKDYKRVQAEAPGFDNIPLHRIREQGRGVVRLIATRATDPLFTRVAQEVILRPSLIHAGGETFTAL